jgi:hypothetical protein
MTRVPYPGNIRRELSSKTHARGGGYKFEMTRPAVITIILLVVITSVCRTWLAANAETTVPTLAVLFVKNLAASSIWAAVLLVIVYAFFAPYKLYDGIARLFGGKRSGRS